LTRQHLADRVGVADGEGVEGVRVLDPRRHHEIEAKNVVLAAEAAGERQNLAIEPIVGLAVDHHEARAVSERVGQEREQRRGLSSPGRAGHGRVLTAVFRGNPQFPPFQIVA
jgi:hypothetical protein